MQHSKDHYHKMIEEVEDYAILMLDPKGCIQNWNRGAEKIKGYTEAEVIGKHFSMFYTSEDQQRKLPDFLIEKARREGKAVHEGWRIRKDGTTFWGSVVITSLHGDNGEIIGFVKVTRDLTERKVAEERLFRYARQLESQNKELQQFAYAAAHDMKEPLRKIRFYNSSLLDNPTLELPDKERTYVFRSADAAKRMQGLIDDLLAFTKISEPVEQYEPVDLNALFKEACDQFQDAKDSGRVLIETERLPDVQGIPFQIRQLFANLLSNSFKYSHSDRELRINLAYRGVSSPNLNEREPLASGKFHLITFTDNGIGFHAEHEEKIFELFSRLHGRDQYSGTGIGLSICRKVMENHKGFIRAKGDPDEGAVFELYFPVLSIAY
ncbi:MAG: PAS domain S-box protein [Bacteroidota bacterium]|nr:PAS domain S-box protein [Bacteroidota bacterium]MDP4216845.1 PAS domain S-box protein [Bacteroidota bacterium]MDP4244830.1 PAS domain S-box protein [Bacteroidota bacterium]MDP4255067.1 PAS domain S-box protein [Bacteroidota bacterium]MDP4260525.1 PAS domain S-box protein [Bacteroidota bacterium]